ncbi:YdcF family protein [Lysobacter koreensis]|uniref:YdcF family protein n=1 Tax=Lysobacter koreensis TaxID=266122 RepID=A0ABW2YJX3_9GAMM
MSSRTVHRLRLFGDRDVLHAAAVATTACVLSAGLVYVGYFVHVLRIARRAPCVPERGECVLLFGKHAPQGRIDRDFEARLDRAVSLWRERPPSSVVLLGGGALDEPSEAEVARQGLFARGLASDAPLRLEAQSRDTLQNLRNARAMLREGLVEPGLHADGSRPRVTLLSSRYHLARCALFARQLGFDAELCAAEPALRVGPRMLLRLAGEAGYVCLSDIGSRWARLIGHRRMIERVS